MSDLEFLFSFYGLLLGLAVANVASGFGEMWRDREVRAVGICAPLLAAIVLFGCMNLWLAYWRIRDDAVVDAWRMLSAACVGLPYIFISRAMFPSESNRHITLEDHYYANRAAILIALAVSPIVSMTSTVAFGGGYQGWTIGWIALRIVGPLVLIPVKSRLGQRLGLTAIMGLLIVGLFR